MKKEVLIGNAVSGTADEYAGFLINRKRGENDYKFIRRIITEIILQIHSTLTVYGLVKEVEKLTDIKINQAYLLNTLIYRDSGIVITGDVISASIVNEKISKNILRAAEDILSHFGGKMEKEDLFSSIKQRTIIPLSDLTISESLYSKNIKQTIKKNKTFYSFKKR